MCKSTWCLSNLHWRIASQQICNSPPPKTHLKIFQELNKYTHNNAKKHPCFHKPETYQEGKKGKVEFTNPELTERKSQPGNFPWTEAFRILSLFTSQSSPDNGSLAFGPPPLTAYLKWGSSVRFNTTSKSEKMSQLSASAHLWLCVWWILTSPFQRKSRRCFTLQCGSLQKMSMPIFT